MSDPITDLVVALFSQPGVALLLAGAILAFGLVLIGASALMEQRPLVTSLIDLLNLLAGIRSKTEFAQQFTMIDQRFSSGNLPPVLTRGWASYRNLLVHDDNGGISTSVHANEVFPRLDEPARSLEWWANILVAVGLTVTFLGIVAALSEATAAIAAGGGGEASSVEKALVGLLAIAATKFWTSIAGVLSSIILRVVARFRRARIEGLETDLFNALDVCVTFAPPERVMLEQLSVLRRLETLMTRGGSGLSAS